MNIKNVTVAKIELEAEELMAIRIVDKLLNEIQDMYDIDTDLINQLTGEVVSINELPRVRGLIDALTRGKEWDVI